MRVLVIWILLISINALGIEKRKIKIGEKTLTVEVAKTEAERAKGLMHRERLKKNTGMLFIFDRDQTLSFWMKETRIPLSIGFINEAKVLVDIQKMNPESVMVKELKVYKSKKPAKYALEVNQGWFEKYGVRVGSRLDFLPKK